jgi:hypothetical protein
MQAIGIAGIWHRLNQSNTFVFQLFWQVMLHNEPQIWTKFIILKSLLYFMSKLWHE